MSDCSLVISVLIFSLILNVPNVQVTRFTLFEGINGECPGGMVIGSASRTQDPRFESLTGYK
jgi:hypothetical protein